MKTLTELLSHFRERATLALKHPSPDYGFLADEAYERLIKSGKLSTANFAYVFELLAHAHIAALVSLRRHLKWIQGMENSLTNPNYFAFSACLRGLIESAGDSYFSIRPALAGLTNNYAVFKRCLEKKADSGLFICKEMEDLLVHFLQAGKHHDKTKAEKHFKASKPFEYIGKIDDDEPSKPIYALYSRLCQILHPARESAWVFVAENPNHTWQVQGIQDKALIESEILHNNEKTLELLLLKALNVSLLTLFFLDSIAPTLFQCPEVRDLDFSKVDGFNVMKKAAGLT